MTRSPLRILRLAIVVCLVSTAAATAADLGDAPYQLPLAGPFAISRQRPGSSRGTYTLLRSDLQPGEYRSGGGRLLVEKVERVAVRDPLIFGTMAGGFFLADVRAPDAAPRTFDSADAWHAALKTAGLDAPDGMLALPDTLAAAAPDQSLRPWNYRVMQNRFGWSDDLWSLMGQLISLGGALLIGRFALRSRPEIFAISLLGGFLAMVSHILVDGQGAFLLLGYGPIVYGIAVAGRSDLDGPVKPTHGP